MKTRNKKLAMMMLAFGTLASGWHAEAREKAGNGGGALLCNNTDGTFKSIQMYDLYEGMSPRYKFPENYIQATNYDGYLKEALKQVRSSGRDSLAAKIEASLPEVEARLDPTTDDLEPTIDATRTFIPVGCKYVQVAIWDDRTGKVDLDTKYYSILSARDQAALKFHEAAYYVARVYAQDIKSDNTREFNAQVFMNQPQLDLIPSTYEYSGVQMADGEYDTQKIFTINWSDATCYRSTKPIKPAIELISAKTEGGHDVSSRIWADATPLQLNQYVTIGTDFDFFFHTAAISLREFTSSQHSPDVNLQFSVGASKDDCSLTKSAPLHLGWKSVHYGGTHFIKTYGTSDGTMTVKDDNLFPPFREKSVPSTPGQAPSAKNGSLLQVFEDHPGTYVFQSSDQVRLEVTSKGFGAIFLTLWQAGMIPGTGLKIGFLDTQDNIFVGTGIQDNTLTYDVHDLDGSIAQRFISFTDDGKVLTWSNYSTQRDVKEMTKKSGP